jgi:hypothetical protein
MRNRVFILIIGAVLASACVKSTIDLKDRSIAFAPVASKATKAIIEGANYPTTESFNVSAYVDGTDAYFQNQTATYSSSLQLWETQESQYWPLNGSLTFYAYSPASASDVSISADGFSATDYTIQTNAQMTSDLCYASATVADCSNHPESVQLTFSHALSQVVFRVKAAAYYTTAQRTVSLAMTSLSLSGIYSVGDFAEGAWENQNTEHTYALSSSTTNLTYDQSNAPVTTVVCSYLFLPQEFGSNAALNVGYSIVQTVSGNDYTLENAPVSIPLGGSISQWEPGKKYIYTLNIGMNNVITFTASSVRWEDENEEIIVEENV